MKHFLTFILALTSLAIFAQQQTAQVDDINYQLNASDATASVISTPAAEGDILIPETITVGDRTAVAVLHPWFFLLPCSMFIARLLTEQAC